MVKGCIRIETRVTQGDEFGIYRITEGKQGYLMLPFDDAEEARVVGKVIASELKVSHHDHIYIEPSQLKSTMGHVDKKQSSTMVDVSRLEGAVRPKPKKVMGALKVCKELLGDTLSKFTAAKEDDVLKVITQKYLDAGHKPESARKFATEVLRVAKKG